MFSIEKKQQLFPIYANEYIYIRTYRRHSFPEAYFAEYC